MCAHLDSSLILVQEEEGTVRVLANSGVIEQVEIDENGGKSLNILVRLIPQLFTLGSWATGKPWSDQFTEAYLVAFWW